MRPKANSLIATLMLVLLLSSCGSLLPIDMVPILPPHVDEQWHVNPHGRSLGKYSLNWSVDQFVEKLGQPSLVVDSEVYSISPFYPDRKFTIRTYSWRPHPVQEIDVIMRLESWRVIGLIITYDGTLPCEPGNLKYRTTWNVRLGSTLTKVKETYGKPRYTIQHNGSKTIVYENGLMLYFLLPLPGEKPFEPTVEKIGVLVRREWY